MVRLVEIKALSNYKLWLHILHRRTGSDGEKGEVDLSELAGKGVFEQWNDYENFEKASIGKNGQIVWSDEIDMCSDSLYMRLTGKTPEEVFPNLRVMNIHA